MDDISSAPRRQSIYSERKEDQVGEHSNAASSTTLSSEFGGPFSAQFFDQSPTISAARAIYLKILVIGVTALGIVVFGVCAIYWGSIQSTPHHSVSGWIVDFDGGLVGQQVIRSLAEINARLNGVVWEVVSETQFLEGISQLENALVEEKTWVIITINAGASSNLAAAVSAVDTSYDPTSAITFFGSEARNEAEYRNVILPLVSSQLETAGRRFALEFARNISVASNLSALLFIAPQIITEPISYTINNIRPFDVPLASAVTFVGLIYLLILAFFMVLISASARQVSGLERRLTLGSLIRVRLATSFVAYLMVALFYTLLSRAFSLPFDRRFGRGGFVIFWILNWIGMLACGLALESLATVLTVRFVPFFLIFWIISNMSVAGYPLEVLPHIYRFGYAYPFYNVSRGARTVIFGTKDNLGTNFGILIAWAVVSCITLSVFQWLMHRRITATQTQTATEEKL